jgi:GGDEF domain-containing protein
MFGRGKQSQQPGKIRLPKQAVFPDMNALKNLYEQAQVNRPQEVELMWSVPGTYKTYCLLIKFDKVTPHPLWNLWEDDGRQSKLVSKFETSDLNLIMDVVMMLETQTGASAGGATGGFAPSGGTGSFPPVGGTGNFPPVNVERSIPPRNNPQVGNYPNANHQQMSGSQSPFQQSGQYNQYTQSGQYQQSGQYGGMDPGAGAIPPALKSTGGYQTIQNPRRTGSHQALGTTGTNRIVPGAGDINYRGTPVISGAGGGVEDTFPKQSSLSGLPDGSLPADFYSDNPAVPGGAGKAPVAALEGNLRKTKIADVLTNIGMNKVTGMLEVISDASIAQVYFVDGTPKHAQAGASRGDAAIKEVVTWRKGDYKFHPKKVTDMTSCEKSLQVSIMEGTALLEQLRHLEAAGLVYESQLVLKQKNLGDTELKLMLSKGHPLDFEWQKQIYEMLKKKRTFTDLLRDRPMDMAQWAPLLFNFLYCGIMDIKEPASARGGALDFLGEGKQTVQALRYNFIKPDTGILSWEAMLYYMEYEYYRFEAYSWPLSFIMFEMNKRRADMGYGVDALPPHVINAAALRIELVKRPLDSLGHFESTEYGLLLPNTRPSQAAFVANRILDALTTTPLAPDVDRRNLLLSFGVAGLPSDGDDVLSLIEAARTAKNEAREGTFPIVLSRSRKRD